MNWDQFWYEAEAVGATVGATIMGGPEAGAATAMYYKGKMDKAEAKKERKNHFVNLRNSATRAGFNPLTALYATGGGGYGQYVGLISRNPLGDALVAGSNAYTAGAARREQMVHDVDMSERSYANEKSLQRMREKAEIKLTRLQQEALEPETKVYLYNKDGSPQLNPYGQHMFVDDKAAEVFPAYQGYMTGDGKQFSAPHEQLLDMGFGGLAAATATIKTGPMIEMSDKAPTAFRYPKLFQTSDGNWTRGEPIGWPSIGQFFTQPKIQR
jgi:hypothetical protein